MRDMRDLRDAHRSTPEPRSTASAADVEEAIAGLVGVVAVRLVTRPDGMIEAVHVAMGPAWRADTVRRDVQALLLHRFDLHVDTAAIHVAQQPHQPQQPPHRETPQPAEPAAPAPRRRPALQEVRVVLRPDTTSVEVELHMSPGALHGSAHLDGPDSLFTAVATATLTALADAVGWQFELVTADIVEAGEDRIAIATVVASDGRGRQRLTGSALVRGHAEDAMTRAVLDATNSLHRT